MPCREASTEELASCHRRDLMAAVAALSARVADEAAAAAAAVAAGTSNGGGGGGHGLAAYDGAGGTTDMPGAVRARVHHAWLLRFTGYFVREAEGIAEKGGVAGGRPGMESS